MKDAPLLAKTPDVLREVLVRQHTEQNKLLLKVSERQVAKGAWQPVRQVLA